MSKPFEWNLTPAERRLAELAFVQGVMRSHEPGFEKASGLHWACVVVLAHRRQRNKGEIERLPLEWPKIADVFPREDHESMARELER